MPEGFAAQFPRVAALGLQPVRNAGGHEYEGCDSEQVAAALGEARYARLLAGVASVFVCGHRQHAADHLIEQWRGAEVHCFYARDVEKFLEQEGSDADSAADRA